MDPDFPEVDVMGEFRAVHNKYLKKHVQRVFCDTFHVNTVILGASSANPTFQLPEKPTDL